MVILVAHFSNKLVTILYTFVEVFIQTNNLSLINFGLLRVGASISFVMPKCMLLISKKEKFCYCCSNRNVGNVEILIAQSFMIVIGLMRGFSSFTIDVKTCDLMFNTNARIKIIFGKNSIRKSYEKIKICSNNDRKYFFKKIRYNSMRL